MSQPTVIVQPSNPTVIASAAGAPGPQGPAGSGGGSSLARTTVKTSAYTAAAGDLVPVDTTSAPVTVTLPSAPADKTQVAVELVTQGGTNTATAACAGSDVFTKTGGPTTLTLGLGQLAWLEYTAAGGIWTQLAGPQTPTGGAVTSGICDMYGLGLCTVDRLTDSGYSSAQSAGDLVLFLVNAPKTATVGTLGIQVTVGGVTGSGVNAMALYTEAGVLIDQTGDMTAAMSSVQFAEGALGSSHTVTAGTNYFLAVLTHFSGGAPKFAATGTTQSSNIPVLAGHYTAIYKSAQAVFPASFTPSSYTLNSGNYVAYAR